MLSENKEKVRQTITYGSPYQALYKGYVSTTDILEYLLDEEVNNETMIAYRSVCQVALRTDDPDEYYQLIDNKPFVLTTDKIEYLAIYILSFGKYYGRDDLETLAIMNKIQPVYNKLLVVNPFSRNVRMVSDIKDRNVVLRRSDVSLLLKSRSKNYDFVDHIGDHHDLWIDADDLKFLDVIKYKVYMNKLLERCETLEREAPGYWEHVGQPLYQEHVQEAIDITHPKMLHSLFSRHAKLFNIFPPALMEMSKLQYNIELLDEYARAYVLGFPIHKYFPSNDLISKAVSLLVDIGIENYVRIITNKTKNWLHDNTEMIDPFDNVDITASNTEDTLTESIHDYSSFDIIKYCNGSHIFHFTRPEFISLLNKKKNHWTSENLPTSVLRDISHRLETSAIEDLPPSKPLIDLLKAVEEETLYPQLPPKCSCPNHQNNNNDNNRDERLRLFQQLLDNMHPDDLNNMLIEVEPNDYDSEYDSDEDSNEDEMESDLWDELD